MSDHPLFPPFPDLGCSYPLSEKTGLSDYFLEYMSDTDRNTIQIFVILLLFCPNHISD